MSNNVSLKAPKINLDDLIKLSHLDVLDYLIKRAAEDVQDLEEFDIVSVSEIISVHYEHLFSKDLIRRYDEAVKERLSMVD